MVRALAVGYSILRNTFVGWTADFGNQNALCEKSALFLYTFYSKEKVRKSSRSAEEEPRAPQARFFYKIAVKTGQFWLKFAPKLILSEHTMSYLETLVE